MSFSVGMTMLGGACYYLFSSLRNSKKKIIECDTNATKNISYWFPHIKDPKKNHYISPYLLVEIYLNPEKVKNTDNYCDLIQGELGYKGLDCGLP